MLALYTHLARPPARIARRFRRQTGQGMVEYGLILVLVSLVVVAALLAVGGQISATFNTIINKLQST
jgi:pilus assembly protein Flp/PilA